MILAVEQLFLKENPTTSLLVIKEMRVLKKKNKKQGSR